MKRRILFTVFAMTTIVSSAEARYCNYPPLRVLSNYYIQFGAGAVYPNFGSSSIRDPDVVILTPNRLSGHTYEFDDVRFRNEFQPGYDINVALGYQFTRNWRPEVYFAYQNIVRKAKGSYHWIGRNSAGSVFATRADNTLGAGKERADIYTLFANLYYDFRNLSNWVTSFGAGLGAAYLNAPQVTSHVAFVATNPLTGVTDTERVTVQSPSLNGVALAAQASVGVAYTLSEVSSVMVIYRIMGSTNFHSNTGTLYARPGRPDQASFVINGGAVSGMVNSIVELDFRFSL